MSCAQGLCGMVRPPPPRPSRADCGCGCGGSDPLALLGLQCSGKSTRATRPSGDPVPAGLPFDQATWDSMGAAARSAWTASLSQGNAWNDYTTRAADAAAQARQQAAADAQRDAAVAGAIGTGLTGVASTVQAAFRADADRAIAESDARVRELTARLASQTSQQQQETQRAIEAERTRQAEINAAANAAQAHASELDAAARLAAAQNAAPTGPSTATVVLVGAGVLAAALGIYYATKGKR